MNNEQSKNEIALQQVVSYDIGETNVSISIDDMKNYIVGNQNVTDGEFKMFTELCKVQKLNPFLNEVYCVKFGTNSASIITSKDVFLKRAINHPMYDGMESGVITLDSDKVVHERQGCFVPTGESLVGGWCKVYRKDQSHPRYMSVSYKECVQKTRDGNPNRTWNTMPSTMIEKVAKSRALREAFMDVMQGLYTSEEMSEFDETKWSHERSENVTVSDVNKDEVAVQDVDPDPKSEKDVKKVMNLNDID